MLPRYAGWFSTTFSGTIFFRADPQVVTKGDLLGFWPVLGRGALREIPGPSQKTEKTQFPGARGPEIGGKSYHAVRDGCPQLSYCPCFD